MSRLMQQWIDRYFERREARYARRQTTCHRCGDLLGATPVVEGHRFCSEACANEHAESNLW